MVTELYLLGSGIRGTLHLTRETEQALRACKRVFALHADRAVLRDLTGYCADVVDLAEMYDRAAVRRAVYEAIAARVVEAAASAPPVGLVVHGHPLFLVSAAEYTLELAAERGIRARVLASVSSFDTILCDLGLDLGYGLQIFDTSTMLAAGWRPNPAVPMLLFQLATTMDDRVVRGHRSGEVMAPIVDLLTPLYGADHEVTLVISAATPFENSELRRMPLAELRAPDVDLTRRPSLYVPAFPPA